MTEDEGLNRPPRRFVALSKAEVRQQRRTAWFMEDIGATLTTLAVLVGMVVVRIMTIG